LRRVLLKGGKAKDKSPSFPLFLRGIKRKVNSPLWKRGVRGDLFHQFPLFGKEGTGEILSFQIPLHPPFSKGEKK